MARFKGQHAIITGGSSGIGKALALALAKEGANISIIARNQAKSAIAQTEIESLCLSPQQRVIAIKADVSIQTEAVGAIERAIAEIAPADLLITCAGIAQPGYFLEIPVDVFESAIAINYFGSLYCVQAVLPSMITRKGGQIVFVSSGAGLVGIYGYSAYSPSKFAVRGLAESLRGELKPLGINISIVYPPDTNTPQLIEENKTKPLETKEITATAKLWEAEDIALEIIRGIEKKVFAIAPGIEITLLHRFHSLFAPLLNWYFDRIVARTEKEKEV